MSNQPAPDSTERREQTTDHLTPSSLSPGDFVVDASPSNADADDVDYETPDAIVLSTTGDAAIDVPYPSDDYETIYDANADRDDVSPDDEVVDVAFIDALDSHDRLDGWREQSADDIRADLADYKAEYSVVVRTYSYPHSRLALVTPNDERIQTAETDSEGDR